MGAKKKPLDVLTLADLGLDAGDAGRCGLEHPRARPRDATARANSITIEDDGNAAQAIVDFLVEQAARVKRPRPSRTSPRRAHQGLARRARKGRNARRRRGRCGAGGQRRPRALAAEAGKFGATSVYVAADDSFDPPLPQPRVDILDEVVALAWLRHRAVRELGARRGCRRGTRRPSRRRSQLGSRRPRGTRR